MCSNGEAGGCPGLSLLVSDFKNASLLSDSVQVKGRGLLEHDGGDAAPSFTNKLRPRSAHASQVRGHSWKHFPGKFRVVRGIYVVFYCNWLIYALFTLWI